MRARVIYKFTCAHCNVCYIGETRRHLKTRIKEHLSGDKNYHVLKHLKASLDCQKANSDQSFTVIDTAHTDYQLNIKEAMHIKWEQPILNQQLTHTKLALIV